MLIILIITFLYCLFIWLVFFCLKWIKFSMGCGIVSALIGIHLLLCFVIGLRFMTPSTSTVTMVQHTIQLIPRLPEPTLLTDLLVKPDEPVKKGQVLFQFDRRLTNCIDLHLALGGSSMPYLLRQSGDAGQSCI